TSSQGNKIYIFPAMGLAILATEAWRVTDEMFVKAAEALAEQTMGRYAYNELIYPPISEIYSVSIKVAIAVATYIFDAGLARVSRPENIDRYVRSKMYFPQYHKIEQVELAL